MKTKTIIKRLLVLGCIVAALAFGGVCRISYL